VHSLRRGRQRLRRHPRQDRLVRRERARAAQRDRDLPARRAGGL